MKAAQLFVLLIPLLTGCGSIEYYSYEGTQTNLPHSDSAFSHMIEGMPIYHGYPSKPYIVLGCISLVDVPPPRTVRLAKAHGADALVVLDQQAVQTGSWHVPEQKQVNYQANTFGTSAFQPSLSPYSPTYGTYNGRTEGTATITTTPAYDIPITHKTARLWAIQFTNAPPGMTKP